MPSTSDIPHPTSDIPQNPDPDYPKAPSLFSDQAFAIALNIARMEALNTLYAAATIRDEKGNPTREAIFAANRILALSIHHDRRAARIAGAGPSLNLPQGGGGGGAAGGGSRIPTSSSASSSSSPHAPPSPSHARPHSPAPASPNLPQGGGARWGGEGGGGGFGIPTASPSAPRIDIQLDIRPPSPRPSITPAAAFINLPQGGGGGGAAGGGSGIPTASSPSSSSTPHSELDAPDFPDDPNDFLALFDTFDDPAEAIATGLNGLMSPEDIVAALARIAANNLAPPPDNRAPP